MRILHGVNLFPIAFSISYKMFCRIWGNQDLEKDSRSLLPF